ncbi:hypothetical protein C0Q70_20570 [Pomacea canaliculata]|uniref:Uncharacterized protein n=1 Tax=Pomacea canaliculata TaxID=400727 RepID=A0A2T7NFZ3_POMCA|nr:hypothetical protein C0Q70_20570 [Pomacea canaliculata]
MSSDGDANSTHHSSTRILGPFTLRNRNNLRFALCSSPEDYTQTLFTPGSRWAFLPVDNLIRGMSPQLAWVKSKQVRALCCAWLVLLITVTFDTVTGTCSSHRSYTRGYASSPPVGRLSPATVRPPLGTKRRMLTFVALSSRCVNAGVWGEDREA